MNSKIEIKKENVIPQYESKFLKVFDLQYAEGRHYYDATRRTKENIMAIKSDEEIKKALPDAATCALILIIKGVPKLLLHYEYRYPIGRYTLSPPAGLVDPEDKDCANPLVETAKREIKEETGVDVTEKDKIYVVNPMLFSSPGMTDESNGIVCAVLERETIPKLTAEGAEGTESFQDFILVTLDEAKKLIKDGRDQKGFAYPTYTWVVLMYFISQMWKE